MADRAFTRSTLALILLVALAIASVAAFLTVDAGGRWDLVLRYRIDDLIALILTGIAVGLSSTVFQTITGNRILTPGIMGFDALFVTIQSLVALALGMAEWRGLPPPLVFAIDLAAMILMATMLYRWLLGDGRRGLHLLVLTGVVLGLLFRSLAAFTGRLADGGDLAGSSLGRAFGGADRDILAVAIVAIVLSALVLWWLLATLDVLTLGRETAISLGVDHRAVVTIVLVISAALAAVSTTLGGPMIFLGLLAANLACLLTGSSRHAVTLPAAALVGTIVLVGGRLMIERWLGLADSGAVINLVGGIVVILMLLKGRAR